MPPEASKPLDLVRFGDFELDLHTGELHRFGHVLKIERIPTDLLRLLVEQRGQLVSRDQIVERIWGKGVFLDTDNSINAAIRKIRQVLKDDPARPQFVQTITGRGYRFIAAVEDVESPSTVQAVNAQPSVAAEELSRKQVFGLFRMGTLQWRLLLAICIFLLLGTGAYVEWARSRQIQPSGRIVLAVLPFENLTGDAGEEYFSDGMTEEMIAQLGRLNPEHLGVIARTSVMRYKHTHDQLDKIGHDLGVQYVLEGSIRRDSNKVRVTAQLIQMRDQTHVWSRQYDRELSTLLGLQEEIAQEIADEIQLTLNGPHKQVVARSTGLSPEAYAAYDLYLKGRYFWNKRTTAGFQQAVEYFQQAIAKDPNYARAYAGLADSYALMGIYNLVPQREFMPKARAAALRALEIDEKLAEAHTSLAVIAEQYDWDWQTAEKEFRRAIQLDSNYATAHHWYAECLAFQGRFDEALAESERARQLDPLSLIIAADNAAILYFSRQYDRSIEKFRAVLDMEPDFPRAHMVIFAYVRKGKFTDAMAQIESWRRLDDSPWTWAIEAYVNGQWGHTEQARRAVGKLEQLAKFQKLDSNPMLATAYAGTGNTDAAVACLQKAFAAHANIVPTLKVDPIYDSLRSDPRFQELVRQAGLAQ
ncbi:MAG TPA: tetratricopeptide repeat protein [Candidatus Angelobacter sp.]|nr:tetratricopeptide repeat protein [Candidatus Angelobacter sp.]